MNIKRKIGCEIFICFLLIILFVGCGEASDAANFEGEFSTDNAVEDDLSPSDDTMEYEPGAIARVSRLIMYQNNDSSGYGYNFYIIVDIDCSEMNDEQFYWFLKDVDKSTTVILCNVTDEANEIDNKRLMGIGRRYNNDGRVLHLCYTYNDDLRYSMEAATSDFVMQIGSDFSKSFTIRSESFDGASFCEIIDAPDEDVKLLTECLESAAEKIKRTKG